MGWGRGRGGRGGFFGGGRGWRHRYRATGVPGGAYYGRAGVDYSRPEPVSEAEQLRQHAADLQAELESINRRLKQMEEENAG
jgi:hypothetical protein